MAVISFDKARGIRQKESTHSKKLEFIIRDFISRCGHGYYDDELDKGILKNYFYLNESVSIEQKIIIRENDCICYSTLSLTLKLTDKLYDTRLLALLVELNDIQYRRVGDYFIPNLIIPPAEEKVTLGKWGMMYKSYLEKHKKALFSTLLIQGKLYQHCAEVENQARDMFC